MTVREAIRAAAARLAAQPDLGDSSARDAELLLLHTLDLARASLFAHPERELTPLEQAVYNAMINRRLTLEPIQYITGEQEFYGLALHVTPAVLIPRPETEHLVEAVLDRLADDQLADDQPRRLLDVGTGSGAIAIALAVHRPAALLTAVDLSPAALTIAQENAHRHHVADRIRFVHSDLLYALPGERFDVIVSNPPYIPEADRGTLHPQVREHEPQQALFADDDGFAIYTRLIPAAHAALNPAGLLAMEIGYGQRDRIAAMLHGWTGIAFVNDLQGIPRVALARRRA
jgi:release factor glutamine methyltransferase